MNSPPSERRLLGPATYQRLVAYLALSLLCVGFALYAGKDLNWDLINYHFYSGHSVFNPRLAQDFFAATLQSYFVPYAYAPIYLLVSWHIDDRAIVILLALWSSTALWGVWEAGGVITARRDAGESTFNVPGAHMSAALAAICPVFFIQVGTSFTDAPTAALVIWGYVLLLRFYFARRLSQLAIAGLLIGMAVGLKQTNAVHALAAVPFLAILHRSDLRAWIVFAGSGFAGGAAAMGPWCWRLYQEFGNPLFPFLNSFFRSPDFPTNFSAIHYRFIPDSLLEAVLRPVWMMSPETGVYTEPPAPDARYVFVFGLLIVGVLASLSRAWKVGFAQQERPAFPALRPTAALTAAFLVAWVLWLIVSGNGRYFMPMALLCGALITSWVLLIGEGRRWRIYSFSSVLLVTVALAFMGSSVRWSPAPWSGRYFDVEVPEELKREPAVYLSLDVQPAAFIAPFVHPSSSLIGVVGMHVLGPTLPGWTRVRQLIDRPVPLRIVVPASLNDDGILVPPSRTYLDLLTARLGLYVDNTKCLVIALRGLPSASHSVSPGKQGMPEIKVRIDDRTLFAVCPARLDSSGRERYISEVGQIDELFDIVVSRCPRLFLPFGVTEGLGGEWRRIYYGSDAILYFESGKVRYRRFSMNRPRVVGTAEEIRRGAFEIECNRKRDPLLTLDDF